MYGKRALATAESGKVRMVERMLGMDTDSSIKDGTHIPKVQEGAREIGHHRIRSCRVEEGCGGRGCLDRAGGVGEWTDSVDLGDPDDRLRGQMQWDLCATKTCDYAQVRLRKCDWETAARSAGEIGPRCPKYLHTRVRPGVERSRKDDRTWLDRWRN